MHKYMYKYIYTYRYSMVKRIFDVSNVPLVNSL